MIVTAEDHAGGVCLSHRGEDATMIAQIQSAHFPTKRSFPNIYPPKKAGEPKKTLILTPE